jgi:Uma2 family endonuclease
VLGSDAVLRLLPQQARAPDVSFVSKRSLAKDMPSRNTPIPLLVPDLAVEVLSKSNTPRVIEGNLRQNFSSGVRLAWVIDLKLRNARIHTSLTRMVEIDPAGVLDGGKVVPGFRITLQQLFDQADELLTTLNLGPSDQ